MARQEGAEGGQRGGGIVVFGVPLMRRVVKETLRTDSKRGDDGNEEARKKGFDDGARGGLERRMETRDGQESDERR